MAQEEAHLHSGRTGAAITVQVVEGASKPRINRILEDGTLEVALEQPVTGSQADQRLIAFLARVLAIKPEKIEIVAGFSGREKLITILDMSAAAVQERILRQV